MKKVRNHIYLHINEVTAEKPKLKKELIRPIKKYLTEIPGNWNFIRINKDGSDMSLLEYDIVYPHPILKKSIRINITEERIGNLRKTKKNPPVLHRAELFFPEGSKEHHKYQLITQKEDRKKK